MPVNAHHDFETRQIHAGTTVDQSVNARVTPIYQTAGYVFADFADGADRFAGRGGNAYSRNDNPTNAVAAARLADLEGGVDGILVASGQAAIAMSITALASSGDHILATRDLYEGTREMFCGILKRQGIDIEYIDSDADDDEWRSRFRANTKAVYTETLPNPLNRVVDIARLAQRAHDAGVPLVVDNTVPTPYLCRPIEHGADIVIHSTSKWLSGHGSVIGGAIIDAGRFDWAAHAQRFPQLNEPVREGTASMTARFGSAAYLAYVRSVIVLEYGPTVPALSTFLLLHGLETLSVRMDRHVATAERTARWLTTRTDVIERVYHPSVQTDPHYERAQRFFPRGAGSLVSFDLIGGQAAAERFIDALQLVTPMTHIGDVRTLAIHLATTIHSKLSDGERAELGIGPGLIRLSLGLESADDILADLDQALTASRG